MPARRRNPAAFLCRLVLLLAVTVSVPGPAAGAAELPREKLVIESDGAYHPFTVEVARSTNEKSRGLMFRERLEPDAGMLFLYAREGEIAMWMKNTLIPLDMIFIDAGGIIVDIHRRAVPHSTATIASRRPALAVLEVNGGLTERLGIRPGDRVRHHAFADGG
ncbi:DUF192 domain-containing protein [Oceanibacterium hippocampi]|uniref:ACR n=1 Tax=Oceanibacterium hippocampi TaxID=745714 RepID=A0A1Y5TZ42_9PROT|nr:DUF192 domain-containing protein [Oceanibacterium hippocampi]SLN76964.1 hypothetical protein OCH7691_04251 [Oceanibacterium hippocampi]